MLRKAHKLLKMLKMVINCQETIFKQLFQLLCLSTPRPSVHSFSFAHALFFLMYFHRAQYLGRLNLKVNPWSLPTQISKT